MSVVSTKSIFSTTQLVYQLLSKQQKIFVVY